MNRKWHKEVGACFLTYVLKCPDRTRQIRDMGFACSGIFSVFGAFLFLFVIGLFIGVNGHGAYAQSGVQENADTESAEVQKEGEPSGEAEEKGDAEESGDEEEIEDEDGDDGKAEDGAGGSLGESEKTQAEGDAKGKASDDNRMEAKEKPRPRATERRADEMPRPVGRVKESQGEDSKVQGGSPGEKPDAKGEEQKKTKGYEPGGDTAVVGGIGMQYGLTDDSVGGFKLGLSYGYRLTGWMWFDAQVNFTFGGNCIGEEPAVGEPKEYACNNVRGFGIEAVAGVQWKFYGIEKWQAPVVPFVRAGLGVVGIISNGPNDGLALVARGSGGVRYHFFPWFAVGGELGVALGPAFRNHLDTGFYAALDLIAGAEFHF